MTTEPHDTLLLPAEAAAELGLSTRDLLARARSGEVPGVLLGDRYWRFSRARLHASMRQPSAAA